MVSIKNKRNKILKFDIGYHYVLSFIVCVISSVMLANLISASIKIEDTLNKHGATDIYVYSKEKSITYNDDKQEFKESYYLLYFLEPLNKPEYKLWQYETKFGLLKVSKDTFNKYKGVQGEHWTTNSVIHNSQIGKNDFKKVTSVFMLFILVMLSLIYFCIIKS